MSGQRESLVDAMGIGLELLRPYLTDEGVSVVEMRDGTVKRLVDTASPIKQALLTKRQWEQVDAVAAKTYSRYIRLVETLVHCGCVFDQFNGWTKMVLEHQVPGKEGGTHEIRATPLPITHCDGQIYGIVKCNERGFPIDTASVECAARRVGEAVEKTFLGVHDWFEKSQAPYQLLGVFNHPDRLSAVNPLTAEVLKGEGHQLLVACAKWMLTKAVAAGFSGPFIFIHGQDLDQYLGRDFLDGSVKDAIQQINAVHPSGMPLTSVKVLHVMCDDWLAQKPLQLALIQVTPDVIRAVIGQSLVVVQWDATSIPNNFKVLTITVPQFLKPGIVTREEHEARS